MAEKEALAQDHQPWSQAEAIALCRVLEPVCAEMACHVALTGGSLYKDGPRKDCDIIVYRAKGGGTFSDTVDRPALLVSLGAAGLVVQEAYDRVVKAQFEGKSVDLIFPEADGEYVKPDADPLLDAYTP